MKKVLAVMLVLVIFSSIGLAADKAMAKGRFAKGMELTVEQEKQLETHRENRKEASKKLREELGKKHKALSKEIVAKDPDEAKLKKIASEIKVIQGKLVDNRITSLMELKKILTPEQFKKMQEMKDKQQEKVRMGKKERSGPKDISK